MKKGILILLALVILAGLACAAASKDPYSFQVKKLYSSPSEDSNLVYNIPIDVQLLDISADGNWHKVKIAYGLGPIQYTYVGWARIPVGEIIVSRNVNLAKASDDNLP